MKKAVIFLLLIILNLSACPLLCAEASFYNSFEAKKVLPKNARLQKIDYIPGEILIKYKKSKINLNSFSGQRAVSNFNKLKSLEKKEDFKKSNISVLRIKDGKTVEQKIADLKNNPEIEYVEPNYKRYLEEINTNDTYKDYLWGLDNIGQTVNGVVGTADNDMDTPEAWAINEGVNATVTVAVIDTGVAYNHPDLIDNMWNGSNCLDENGEYLGDCNYGYDFEDNDKTPLPTNNNHGTHVAGTIAAIKNNSKGIIGLAPNAKIMALKFDLDVASEIRAIDFAIQNGVKIINASYGGTEYSQAEYDAINRFRQAGGIFVAAAGNDHTNNENDHKYPSDYNLDNIISVAATDQNDNLASFSNYGTTSVDVAAPGVNIYSTIPQSISAEILNKNFEDLDIPNIPDAWATSSESYWGTKDVSDFWTSQNKALVGDVNMPYTDNASTTITAIEYDLHDVSSAYFDFQTACDTEYDINLWTDYMAIEVSSNGEDFVQLERWDEYSIDGDSSSSSYAFYHFQSLIIPNEYLTATFKFRLRWVTNASNNNYGGCAIDDLKIIKNYYDDGASELYQFKNGTSMATPQVAGLAALIKGYNTSILYPRVKSVILSSGDELASLSGKTVSGKRINAQKALQAVDFSKEISSFYFSSPMASGTIDQELHTVSLTVPFETDVTALIPTINITGSSVNPISGVAQDFSEPVEYIVTNSDGLTQNYLVTVIIDADPDIALVTADKDSLTQDFIKGDNSDLSNIIFPLNILPSEGENGSVITWVSDNPEIISNDGQILNRPIFINGNATTTLTATFEKGEIVDSKEFLLTIIKLPPSNIATVNSEIYLVSNTGISSGVISNIPFGNAKTTFLSNLSKGQENQSWNISELDNPVVSGNFLLVTAQNGTTTFTYTITTLANPSSFSGGGGGGGGVAVVIPDPIAAVINATSSEDILNNNLQASSTIVEEENTRTENPIIREIYSSLYGLESAIVNRVSLSEAEDVSSWQDWVTFSGNNKEIYLKISSPYLIGLSDLNKENIAYFIEFGTPTTKILGSGERAGALNSYISTFGKVPDSAFAWQDVIKIANGRWPSQRNLIIEDQTQKKFKQIYLREANMNNSNDSAAVNVMAYGLRPAKRNMNSEKTAINFFKLIYKKNPVKAEEWDIVRAIAYSGATR